MLTSALCRPIWNTRKRLVIPVHCFLDDIHTTYQLHCQRICNLVDRILVHSFDDPENLEISTNLLIQEKCRVLRKINNSKIYNLLRFFGSGIFVDIRKGKLEMTVTIRSIAISP